MGEGGIRVGGYSLYSLFSRVLLGSRRYIVYVELPAGIQCVATYLYNHLSAVFSAISSARRQAVGRGRCVRNATGRTSFPVCCRCRRGFICMFRSAQRKGDIPLFVPHRQNCFTKQRWVTKCWPGLAEHASCIKTVEINYHRRHK